MLSSEPRQGEDPVRTDRIRRFHHCRLSTKIWIRLNTAASIVIEGKGQYRLKPVLMP